MKTYEITIVINPDLSEDVRKKVLKGVADLVEKNKGKVEKTEDMGKKELSYSISKKNYGFYHFFKIQLEENKVADVDRGLRFTEELIRYLLIAVE
jgi:small subunit ribosomal protein S6